MEEFNKDDLIDRLYEQTVDDYLTGHIGTISDSNLFFMIDRFGLEPLSDTSVLEIRDRFLDYNKKKDGRETIF